MNAVEIRNLTKVYKDVTAVDNLSLTIPQGELFALLGVNGAGKTTTIKMLATLLLPTSGDAFLQGHSIVTEPRKVRSILGVSPQETAVAPNLTVVENLELMRGIYGKSRETMENLITQFHLDQVRKKPAGKLSGGWQRRLSIAMALIGQPEILFLDEPTLGLDVLTRQELWQIIKGLKGTVTIILTTHYMEEAEALADGVGILGSGHLLALGTAEELKRKTGMDNLEKAFVAIVREAGL